MGRTKVSGDSTEMMSENDTSPTRFVVKSRLGEATKLSAADLAAASFTPAIEFVCRQADIEICEFGAIAVDIGPGLFTGMRVGLAAGKAIAHALRVPMIGISSLDLLAFPLRYADRTVAAVIARPAGILLIIPCNCASRPLTPCARD